MKELSIEEKAKRYDEAIEKATIALKDEDRHLKATLERIFPSLKENEDERIRKALIEHFNFSDKNVYYEINGIPHKKVIAWLEKQGQTFTKKDVDDAYLKGICDAKHELEKQGEQKPTDEEMIALLRTEYEKGRADAIAEMQKSWSEEDESMLTRCIGILGKCYIGELPTKVEEELNWLKYLSDRVQLQPKQEWSEDDERKIELLKSLIEDAKGDSTSYSTMFREMEELNNWLKSLKNRVLPQSRQEWGEDDENRINRLIAYFEDKESFTAEDDVVYANWFKSLKDRYTWKPSDSQMGALWDSIKHNLHLHPVLESLYNDLKKLKG